LLNKYYKQALNKLDAEHKSKLRQLERDWLKHRKSKCNFFYGLTGGTIDMLNGGSCYLDMTANRVQELRYMAEDY